MRLGVRRLRVGAAAAGSAAGAGLGLAVAAGLLASRAAARLRRDRDAYTRLARMVVSAPDAIVAVDARGLITEWNAAASRLLGYAPDEAAGVALKSLADGAASDVLDGALRRSLEGGEAWLPAVALRARSGRRAVVSASVAPLWGPDGAASGAVAVLRERAAGGEDLDCPGDAPGAGAERARDLIDKAPEGIFIVGPDDRYVDINAAACELLGYQREQVVGRHLGELSPPEQRHVLAALRVQLSRQSTLTKEWLARRADGRVIPLEIRARMLPDGSWHAFVRDVSAYKDAAEGARRSAEDERRQRSRVEAVDSALQRVTQAVADVRGAGIEAVLQSIALQAAAITGAQYAAAALGVRPGEPIEHFVFAGLGPERAAMVGRHPLCTGVLAAVARGARPLRLRDVRTHPEFGGLPSGHPDVRSLLGVPIRQGRRLIGMLLLANRRGREEFSDEDQVAVELLVSRVVCALHAARGLETEASQRAWLQSVIEDMPDAVVVVDHEGNRVSLNRAATELSRSADGPGDGAPIAETFRARWPDGSAVPPEAIPALRALSTGETVTGVEMQVRNGHGRMTPVLVSAAPINSSDGECTGAVMLMRDISSLKELERLREEWSALVAHELKQPLAQIATWAELLQRRAVRGGSPEDMQTAQQIRSGVRRMSRMVADLHDASRLEARKLELTLDEVDLPRLLRDAAARATQAEPDHPVRVEVAPGLPPVLADALRLEQVVDNLLSNAAKYGRPGSEVLVQADTRGGEVLVQVTNEGRGLSPEEQARLFERFYRAGGTEGTKVAGSGLGLYIARGIVQAHGGRIWVESTPGAYTTFGFALPAREGAASQARGSSPAA